jgi:hypothetical protein
MSCSVNLGPSEKEERIFAPAEKKNKISGPFNRSLVIILITLSRLIDTYLLALRNKSSKPLNPCCYFIYQEV